MKVIVLTISARAILANDMNKFQLKMCNAPVVWTDAKKICRAWGGDLASMPTPHQQADLITLTADFKGNAYWIGLNELGEEGEWQWSDDTPLTYLNWAKGQPNNKRNDSRNENCVAAWFGNRQWHDMLCYAALPFVCKRS